MNRISDFCELSFSFVVFFQVTNWWWKTYVKKAS